MKILFITYRLPNPKMIDGYAIRVLNIAKILKTEHSVDLVSIYDEKKELEFKPELEKIFDQIFLFKKGKSAKALGAIKGVLTPRTIQEDIYSSSEMKSWIEKNAKNYDFAFFNTIRTAKYAKNIKIKKVIDLIESLALKYSKAKKFVNPFWKCIYALEIPRVKKAEKKALKDFDKVFISSHYDKEYIIKNSKLPEAISSRCYGAGKAQNSKLVVVPNGVKEELFSMEKKTEEIENFYAVAFFGKMNYQPNVDAVLFFVKEIMPRAKKMTKTMADYDYDKVKFYVVGTNPARKVRRLAGKDIVVTGYLENPYKVLLKSSLVVLPLRFGAGIQNKVLEAMALGKAVLTSPIGAKGIPDAKNGIHLEVEDPNDPCKFAKKLINLLFDPKKRRDLGKNARDLIIKNYSWEKIGKVLLKEIRAMF